MTPGSRRSFLLTNVVVNRLLIPLLQSRAGGRLGARLAVVEYVGRRSGRQHRLVTQYVIEGNRVLIMVGLAERKTWWRNFLTVHPLHLRLAGHEYDTAAHVVRDHERVSVIAELGRRAS
jgi:hypothetical protein